MDNEQTMLDARWQALTHTGNEALAQENGATAQEYYEAALAQASQLFEQAEDARESGCEMAPMLYNIAAYNLAECHRRRGNTKAMADCARQAVETLVQQAGHTRTPVMLRLYCIRHLPRAIANLEQFCPGSRDQPYYQSLLVRVEKMHRQFPEQVPAPDQVGEAVH